VILVDATVPMYLVGVASPTKDTAQRLLEVCIERGERLVTDAEALLEILHRYRVVRRPGAIQPAFDALLGVVDEVFPVEPADVEAAKGLMLGLTPLSARVALHAAIMKRRGVSRVLSFDPEFDAVGWIERLR
jgi:predicted nucleic acid-binding protein